MHDDHDPLQDRIRLNPGDEPASFTSPRFARLVGSPAVRRFSPRRLALALGLGSTVVWGLSALGFRSADGLAAWVARQPEHQIAFAAIELMPPPPPYIRTSASDILEAVRREGKYEENLSVLNLDLDAFRTALKRNHWFESVGPIRAYHGRIVGIVAYRKPLALVTYPVPGESVPRAALIDRNAVEMISGRPDYRWAEYKPRFRLEGDKASLIEIHGLGAGENGRLGRVWKPNSPTVPEDKVLRAVQIAEFLADRSHRKTPKGLPFPSFLKIEYALNPEDPDQPKVFLLEDERGNQILWDACSGQDPRFDPNADEKWEMLGHLIDKQGSFSLPGRGTHFLKFDRDGSEIRQRVRVPARKR